MNGIFVIGFSTNKMQTSDILRKCCDEFILLDDSTPEYISNNEELIILKKNIIHLLDNTNDKMIRISLLKDKLLQIDSSFTETNYGFDSFSKLLESMNELRIERYETTLFVSVK